MNVLKTAYDFLELEHKQTMLGLVLTWGSIDVSLGRFAAVFFPEEAICDVAKILSRVNASGRLHQIIKTIEVISSSESSRKLSADLKRAKKKFEKYSKTRDILAHSKLIKYSNARANSLVFLKFEVVGEDRLAMDEVPVREFENALSWGTNFDNWLRSRIAEATTIKGAGEQ